MSDFWNQRYTREDYLFGETPNAFLARQQALLRQSFPEGGRALAIADGEGRNGVWLAEQGFRVHAFDSSAVALEKARKLAASRRVELELEEVDLTTWPWPVGAYDIIVGIFIQFLGPDERARLFENIVMALKPGGLLLLEGYAPRQVEFGTGGPSTVDNLYTEEMLSTAFSRLDILDLKAYEAEIAEGSAHNGMSALVDLVARKPE